MSESTHSRVWRRVAIGGAAVLALAVLFGFMQAAYRGYVDRVSDQAHAVQASDSDNLAAPSTTQPDARDSMSLGQKLALLNLGEQLSPDDDRVQGVNLALIAASTQYAEPPDLVADQVWLVTKKLRGEGIEADAFQVLGVAVDGYVPVDKGGTDLPTLLAHYYVLRQQGWSHERSHALIRELAKAYNKP